MGIDQNSTVDTINLKPLKETWLGNSGLTRPAKKQVEMWLLNACPLEGHPKDADAGAVQGFWEVD